MQISSLESLAMRSVKNSSQMNLAPNCDLRVTAKTNVLAYALYDLYIFDFMIKMDNPFSDKYMFLKVMSIFTST